MEKQLKDYLHLYLGCEVVSTGGKHMGNLVGVSVNQATVNPLDKFDPRVTVIEYLKPILRPLSDMDGEEAEYFAWLCTDSKYHLEDDTRVSKDEIEALLVHNDGGLQLDDDVEIYIEITCRCWEGAVLIMKDGRIGVVDIDQPSEKMKPVDAVSEKVIWLLAKHFDLFGLIEAGLAIDATGLKVQECDATAAK